MEERKKEYPFKPPIDVFFMEITAVDTSNPGIPEATFAVTMQSLTSLTDLRTLSGQMRDPVICQAEPQVGARMELSGCDLWTQVITTLMTRSNRFLQDFYNRLMKVFGDCEQYDAQKILEEELQKFKEG